MSSRNRRLDAESRLLAGRFNRLLAEAKSDDQARLSLQAAGMQVAYVSTLGQRRCGAVVLGDGSDAIRLIDNVPVKRLYRRADEGSKHMILVLDVGNSQIFCGVFEGDELVSQFRYASTGRGTSDEIGVFLRSALRENGIDPEVVKTVAISSVVPELNYTLRSCCQKYFGIEPMILRPGLKTGLKIAYKDPKEVGSDRIADAMGAIKLFPDRNLIVVDFGTATTVCAIT